MLKKRWDRIYIAGFIYYKFLDIILLTFFDIFDNSDLFNSTLAITIEKFLWMIIETLFYSFEVKTKNLIIIQTVFSIITIIFYFVCLCCGI